MAPRTTKNEPSFDLIWLKFGGASYHHHLLKQHQEQQRRLQKPPAREFSYNLDAFLNAARSVGKLLERKRPKKTPEWWKLLNPADRALHDRIWDMRDETVYAGQVETNQHTEEVEVRFEPTSYLHGTIVHVGFGFRDQFGKEKTTVETHSVKLLDTEREVAGLCEEYLAIPRREIAKLQQASLPPRIASAGVDQATN